jgi:Protein of unknown function (DUF3307)
VSWPAALLALLVSHVVGDVLLQTEWQARMKTGGLGNPAARRALAQHVTVYTLAFVPALMWIGLETNAGRAVAIAALVSVPHLLVDDGWAVRAWIREVKRVDEAPRPLVIAVDQSFHLLCLLGAALVAAI